MSSSRPIGLTPKQFGATNALVTLAAMSFLVWLVYFHEGNGADMAMLSAPPRTMTATERAGVYYYLSSCGQAVAVASPSEYAPRPWPGVTSTRQWTHRG